MKFCIKKIVLFLIVAIFTFVFLMDLYVFSIPSSFPLDTSFKIAEGSSLSEIANQLNKQGLVRSSNAFIAIAKLRGLEKKIRAGEYWFQNPLSAIEIIERFEKADFGFSPLKVTVPEGSNMEEIAEIFVSFDHFNREEFLKQKKEAEGYLFPDTYFFLPNVTLEKVILAMKENFNKRIKKIEEEIKKSSRPLDEIIVMASLIEKEIADSEDRKIVSGILWKRLDNDIPLQVDAVFPYIMDKNSYQLSLDDLKFDSPYNTYRYKGLPPTPICNPGLDAILAAANPGDSPYWYYLSDKKGNTYFAKTFDEHKINKAKYLR